MNTMSDKRAPEEHETGCHLFMNNEVSQNPSQS